MVARGGTEPAKSKRGEKNMKCSECGFSKSSLNHYTGSADYDHPFKAAQCPTCFAEVKQPVTRCIRTCHSHVPSPCVTCTDKWHTEI